MDLRERLQRLGVQKGIRHLKAPTPQPRQGQGIEQFIPGELVETEYGRFFLGKEDYPASHYHGAWPLAAALTQCGANILPLACDTSLENLDFRSAIFLDTETTGLAGGTGTYVFLVGIGYFEDDAFCVRQFFMRDYDDEPAMLSELARLLGRFSALVSFNGRAFDWPLLETRFTLARWSLPLRNAPHLDLLQLARRLWRVRLSSCALSSLEEHILGVQRSGEDVPGWMVPEIYFQYLRSGDPRPLRQVFYHNAQDVLSLVTLAACLGQIGGDPFNGCLSHGADFYSLAKFFEASGDADVARRAYERALTCPLPEGVQRATVARLSLLYKRLGQQEKATSLWRSALGDGQLYPYIELAKYYEHSCKEYTEAASLVCAALDLVRSAPGLSEYDRQQLTAELEHRLQRLRRKM